MYQDRQTGNKSYGLRTRDPCVCEIALPPEDERQLLSSFHAVRRGCPAIRRILIPDWKAFVETDRVLVENQAIHRSIYLRAYQRGYIRRLTSPLHLFLLENGDIKREVKKSYLRELSELWTREATDLKRHQESRRFTGKFEELQIAHWLWLQGWNITNLAALDGPYDIEAVDQGEKIAFEVKYIGCKDDDFLEILGKPPQGGFKSPYEAADYLLFRTFEAAYQLKGAPEVRIAIIAVSARGWGRFDFIPENSLPGVSRPLVNWLYPEFISKDPEWIKFLRKQEKRYLELQNGPGFLITTLNQVFVIRSFPDFRYRLEFLHRHY